MTLALAGGIVSSSIMACNQSDSGNGQNHNTKPIQKYEFTGYGKEEFIEYGFSSDITQIRTADLDNDGDLDIIVGDESGFVYLFENNMPQKNK